MSAFVGHLELSDIFVELSMDVLIPASNVAAAVIALVSENIFADVIPPGNGMIASSHGGLIFHA